MYRKIDIYVNKEYFCSTNQAKNLPEAKIKFLSNPYKATIGKNGIEMVKPEIIYDVQYKYSEEK